MEQERKKKKMSKTQHRLRLPLLRGVRLPRTCTHRGAHRAAHNLLYTFATPTAPPRALRRRGTRVYCVLRARRAWRQRDGAIRLFWWFIRDNGWTCMGHTQLAPPHTCSSPPSHTHIASTPFFQFPTAAAHTHTWWPTYRAGQRALHLPPPVASITTPPPLVPTLHTLGFPTTVGMQHTHAPASGQHL